MECIQITKYKYSSQKTGTTQYLIQPGFNRRKFKFMLKFSGFYKDAI